jgi:dihydrofolate reductase
MKHFREITRGHTVIMGQKTFESIGHPLPNRRNIVLTEDNYFKLEGVEIFHSLDALEAELPKKSNEEIFVIGGGQIYKLFIDFADKLYITHVDAEFPDAEIFFPIIDDTKWQKTKSEKYGKDDQNQYDLEFAEYIKKVS